MGRRFKVGKTELFETLFMPEDSFLWGRKLFRMTSQSSFDFPDRVFRNHRSNKPGDWCVLKSLRRSVDGNHVMRFQSQTSVIIFEIFRLSVNGVLKETTEIS